jgi:hypothetical protein
MFQSVTYGIPLPQLSAIQLGQVGRKFQLPVSRGFFCATIMAEEQSNGWSVVAVCEGCVGKAKPFPGTAGLMMREPTVPPQFAMLSTIIIGI